MDPVQRIWMFYSWIQDNADDVDKLKQQSYLIGGFSNPEMLNKILENEKNLIKTDDKDFEKSLQIVKQENIEEEKISKRRKRRKKIGN